MPHRGDRRDDSPADQRGLVLRASVAKAGPRRIADEFVLGGILETVVEQRNPRHRHLVARRRVVPTKWPPVAASLSKGLLRVGIRVRIRRRVTFSAAVRTPVYVTGLIPNNLEAKIIRIEEQALNSSVIAIPAAIRQRSV